MEQSQRQPVGSLKISQDVIVTITQVAAMEIEGVHSLADSVPNLKGLFGAGKTNKRIQVNLSDDFAEIQIHLNLRYGAKITEVCPAVQAAVKESVQSMTGIAVSKVNVFVSGIVFADEAEEAAY